jgi:hypothetical protein
MDEWEVLEGHQAPDRVAEKPVVQEMAQVMKWIGFDDAKTERVAAQIGGKIRDFAELSHSDVKMLTESLRGLPTNVRIHVSLAQAKKIKATIGLVKDQDRPTKTPSIAGLDKESFLRSSAWSKTKTDRPRHLRLPVWTRSHSSVPYESLPSAKLFARQTRRMLRSLPRRHPLGNSLVRRFGISERQE